MRYLEKIASISLTASTSCKRRCIYATSRTFPSWSFDRHRRCKCFIAGTCHALQKRLGAIRHSSDCPQLKPEDLAIQAHRAGYSAIGIRINPISKGSVAYPYKAGSAEIKAFKNLLNDLGMRVQGVDGFALNSFTDPMQFQAIFDTCGELGIKSLCICGDAPDKEKFANMFGKLCDMAAPYGFRIDLEFMAWRTIGTLEQAYELVKMADRKNGTIAVDSLHLYRSGGTAADIDKVPARFLGDIHLCDAVRTPPIDMKLIQMVREGRANLDSTSGTPKGFEGLVREAREGRLLPGDGELPLVDFMKHMPRSCAIGVEVPVPGLDSQTVLNLSYAHSVRVLEKLC